MNRTHLKNLYDCINRIAQEHKARGNDRTNWFYTEDEFNQIKKDDQNNIL
jgi:hypothetical protein